MHEKPNLGDIREALKQNKKLATHHSCVEGDWIMRDSSLEEFAMTFSDTLPDSFTHFSKKIYVEEQEYSSMFKSYIQDVLSRSQNKKLFAIEFGGPGSNLFFGFDEGFFKKTVGVCLDDIRDPVLNNIDDVNNHFVVSGDIMDVLNNDVYESVKEKLSSQKIDLIISRIMGPLRDIDKNPAILKRIIEKWYSLLNNNVLMFVQYEYFSGHNPYNIQKYNFEISNPEKTKTEKLVDLWVDDVQKNMEKISSCKHLEEFLDYTKKKEHQRF